MRWSEFSFTSRMLNDETHETLSRKRKAGCGRGLPCDMDGVSSGGQVIMARQDWQPGGE